VAALAQPLSPMRLIWHRFLQSLTPGVRVVLGVLAAAYLAEAIGRWSSAYDLSAWLALSGPVFWKGRVWLLVTYGLLPAGILNLLFNGMMIACLAAILIMDEMGTPGEGTRPTSGRFCGGCRPGALTRRGVTRP